MTQGYRKKNEFEFNKDDGMYVCKAGNMSIRKAQQGKKTANAVHYKKVAIQKIFGIP